jgi:hypothetical protein
VVEIQFFNRFLQRQHPRVGVSLGGLFGITMPHERHAHTLARRSRCELSAISDAEAVKVQATLALIFPINSSGLQVGVKLFIAGEHSFEN